MKALLMLRPWLPALVLPLFACTDAPRAGAGSAAPVVYTTFYPTTYFTQRIASGVVPVVCPLPAGADPIFWQPSREVLTAYRAASLIVVNGAGFEKWIEQASLPLSRIVDSSRGLEDPITYESAATHSHGVGGEHTHEGIDGHTWLDPVLALEQTAAIRDALVQHFPDHEATFLAGHRALADDLEELERRLTDLTEHVTEARLLASHPAYNYLARRYDWTVRNFDLDPGALLTDEQIAAVREAAAGGGRVVMLWESEPRSETVAVLDGLGVTSVLFTPCETVDESGDYLERMRRNADRLAEAVRQRGR